MSIDGQVGVKDLGYGVMKHKAQAANNDPRSPTTIDSPNSSFVL